MEIDKKAQGRKNRRKGAKFELDTRKDFENRGYEIVKFQNNVDLDTKQFVKAKQKYINGRGMGLGSGFPDFLVFTNDSCFFVECKTNNILSKEEKLKINVILNKGYQCFVAYEEENKTVGFRELLEYQERKKVC